MKNKIPNFLIVGAAKSGTTSLHNYLNQHPDIFMPSYDKKGMKVKEPRFLVKEIVKKRVHYGIWDLDQYYNLFNEADGSQIIGESTVLYLFYYNHAIKNIKKYLGNNVKIIIMLRNPIERAYSAYMHVSRGLDEKLSFKDALDAEQGRLESSLTLTPMVMYKAMGLYYNMVKAYMDNFQEVRVIFFEEFTNNTLGIVEETCSFLGVAPGVSIDTSKKHNVGGRRWRSIFLKNFFMRDHIMNKFFKLVIPLKARKVIRDFLVMKSTKKHAVMAKNVREELQDFFREDIEKLSILLKKDLKHWLN